MAFSGGETGIAQLTVRATNPNGAFDEATFKVYIIDVTGLTVQREQEDGTWLTLDDDVLIWEDDNIRWLAEFGPVDVDFPLDSIDWEAAQFDTSDPVSWVTFASTTCDCYATTNPGLGNGVWHVTPRVHFDGQTAYLAQLTGPDDTPEEDGRKVITTPAPKIDVFETKTIVVSENATLAGLTGIAQNQAIASQIKTIAAEKITATTTLTNADLPSFRWAFNELIVVGAIPNFNNTEEDGTTPNRGTSGVFFAWKVDADTGSTYAFAMPYIVIFNDTQAPGNTGDKVYLGDVGGVPQYVDTYLSTLQHEKWHTNGASGEQWTNFKQAALNKGFVLGDVRGFRYELNHRKHIILPPLIKNARQSATTLAGYVTAANTIINSHFTGGVARMEITAAGYWHSDLLFNEPGQFYYYNWVAEITPVGA